MLLTRRLHLIVGAVTLIVFLGTGFYLRRIHALLESEPATRYVYRANHLYILFAGLLNLALGAYLARTERRRSRRLQMIGSTAMLLAPLVLMAAFALETRTPNPLRPVTSVGVLLTFAGTLCHAFAVRRRATGRRA